MDSDDLKKTLLIICVMYGVGVTILFGLTVFPSSSFDPLVEEKIVLDTVSGDVVESSIAYEELSNSEKKIFRSAQSGETDFTASQTDLVGSVISLDESYYHVGSNSQTTLLGLAASLYIPIFTSHILFGISVITNIESQVLTQILMFFTAIFIVASFIFIHYTLIGTIASEEVSISTDPVSVSDPSSVVEVENLDSRYSSKVYSVITGGEPVSIDNAEYSILSHSTTYSFMNYEYVSSDGEVYHLKTSEKNYSSMFKLVYFLIFLSFVGQIGSTVCYYRDKDLTI